MADRWRDDDRFDRGERGGFTNERREFGARGDIGDYDRDIGGQGYRGGDRGQRSAYSGWSRNEESRDTDDYTRSFGGQRNDRWGPYGERGYGYEGNRYGSEEFDRLSRNQSAQRTYRPGYDDERTSRGRLDGVRGFRTNGYGFDDDDGSRSASYRRDRDERGWFERAGDEVRSWFGSEDTDHRRGQDHRDQYRGLGPKGYNRSDERIREDVCDRLSDDWRIDASDIEVQVKEGEVTLTGTVRDRQLKRRVEDVVDDVSGVRNVQNSLRVQPQSTGTTGLNQQGSSTGSFSQSSTRETSQTGIGSTKTS